MLIDIFLVFIAPLTIIALIFGGMIGVVAIYNLGLKDSTNDTNNKKGDTSGDGSPAYQYEK